MLDHEKGDVTQYRYLNRINHKFKISSATHQLLMQDEVSKTLPCTNNKQTWNWTTVSFKGGIYADSQSKPIFG